MRLYFHLINSHRSIPDPDGIEVGDLGQVRTLALETLQEVCDEDSTAAEDWLGWTLSVTDATGAVFVTVELAGIGRSHETQSGMRDTLAD